MIAQNSANFLIFSGHARQRGRGFGALAQTLGKFAIPFIKKYLVQTAKISLADLFGIKTPEIGEFVSGQKNSNHLQKMLEQKQLVIEKRNLSVRLVKSLLKKTMENQSLSQRRF